MGKTVIWVIWIIQRFQNTKKLKLANLKVNGFFILFNFVITYMDILLALQLLLYYFPNLHLQIKMNKTFKNTCSVLFLGWYTHCYIVGNPLAQWFPTFWASSPGKRQMFKLLSRSNVFEVLCLRIMCFMDPKTPNKCQICLHYSFSRWN